MTISRSATMTTKQNYSGVEIQQLNTSSGLFFEEISYLKLYDADWNIVSKIDLSYFSNEINKIKITLQSVVELKVHIDQIPYNYSLNESNNILNEFINIVEEIEQYNHQWFSLPGFAPKKIQNKHRSKRAAISTIGTLSKSLFGTLDAKDGMILGEMLANLKQNGINQQKLSKMRTSILSTAIEEFTNITKEFDQQQQIIDKKLKSIKLHLRDFNLNLNSNSLKKSPLHSFYQISLVTYMSYEYRGLIDYLILTFQNFFKTQKLFLKSLTISQTRSSSSPYLISPKTLMNELKKIKKEAEYIDYSLPFEVKNENLALFYQMSVIFSQIIDGNLYIKYSLPLVRMQTFLLHKVTSFPYSIGKNLYSFLIPRNEFIAIDEKSDLFFITLTKKEVQECFRTHSDTLLCRNSFPIFNSNVHNNCELNILLKRNDTTACDIRVLNSTGDLCIKLEKPNTYLYNLPKPTKLKLVCPHKKSDAAFLTDAGIISIKEGCLITTPSITITAFQSIEKVHFKSEVAPMLEFHINISDEVDRIIKTYEYQLPSIEASNIIGDGQSKKLFSISSSINDLYKFEKYSKAKLTPKTMNEEIIWMIITIIICIAAITTFIVLKFGYKIYLTIWAAF